MFSSQAQGVIYDRRRRLDFAFNPGWFVEECDRLGLFTTRMPRFTQLFFYNFSEAEFMASKGQPEDTNVASWRAARAYLRSGVRLQSMCGISDVWYRYVETHRELFLIETPTPPPEQEPVHLNPRIEDVRLRRMWETFEWKQEHLRLSDQVRRSRGGQPSESMENLMSSQQTEEISDYTEDGSRGGSPVEESGEPQRNTAEDNVSSSEAGEGRVGRESADSTQEKMGEEKRQDTAGEDLEGDGAGSRTVGVTAAEGFYDFDWPTTASFNEALAKGMAEVERIPEYPCVITDTFVPSSVPEERELRLDPPPVGLTYGLNGVGGAEEIEQQDLMEGVEASQPTQVQVHALDVEFSVPGGDEQEMDLQGQEYAADCK